MVEKNVAPAVKKVVTENAELRSLVKSLKAERKSIGVVPTMGALHEGHLSLVQASLKQADVTIVTIFVNPTQFAPGEDLRKYPRPMESDLQMLAELGVEYVFAPSPEEIYPPGFSTSVVPPNICKTLEGEYRPAHFAGVATIVLKLFNLTQADWAFFGQKDFQQQLVVKRMVRDFNVPIEVVVCPIVRDEDGLALSSRNVYLSAEEREIGLTLSRTLDFVEQQIRDGHQDGYEMISEMRQQLIDGGVTSIDYTAIADPETLKTVDQIEMPVVALIAAYVGKTRLIDNRVIDNK